MPIVATTEENRRDRAPLVPAHPERVCWGCDKYCPAHDLACGNGTIRSPHPCELFGQDWRQWMDERRRGTGTSAGESDAAAPSDPPSDLT
jgi:hypothetical protein